MWGNCFISNLTSCFHQLAISIYQTTLKALKYIHSHVCMSTQTDRHTRTHFYLAHESEGQEFVLITEM